MRGRSGVHNDTWRDQTTLGKATRDALEGKVDEFDVPLAQEVECGGGEAWYGAVVRERK